MANQVLAKGATPIIASTTPDNPYANSTVIVDAPSRVRPFVSFNRI